MTSLTCHRIEACRQEIVPDNEGVKAWRREAVLSVADVPRVSNVVVARGASGDSFFQCHQGKEVLVVWQTRAREMVVHVRRPLPTQPLAFTDDAVPFPPAKDSWNTFTCSITRGVMVHLVNGQPITAKNHYKNEVSQSRTFQLEPKGQQSLEVKSFTVKPLQP
jgi:hypothetical protein